LRIDPICIVSIFKIRLTIPATVENPPIIIVWISDSVKSGKYGLMIIGASDYNKRKKLVCFFEIVTKMLSSIKVV